MSDNSTPAAQLEPVAPDADERVSVYVLTLDGTFLVLERDDLSSLPDHTQPGDVYTLEVKEMTRAEINALPEFDGF